jgi:hypothetical protein
MRKVNVSNSRANGKTDCMVSRLADIVYGESNSCKMQLVSTTSVQIVELFAEFS